MHHLIALPQDSLDISEGECGKDIRNRSAFRENETRIGLDECNRDFYSEFFIGFHKITFFLIQYSRGDR